MNKVPMTVRGAELLARGAETAQIGGRPAIIKAIAEARAHGDLKENAEYHAAKEQQGFIEARIKDIEGKLSNIQDHRRHDDRCQGQGRLWQHRRTARCAER